MRCAWVEATPVHLNMGTMYLAAGELDQAQKAYERALAADGAIVKAHLGLSRIAQRHGGLPTRPRATGDRPRS
ncbi:MAG: tetratricopeptide repeat protein [Bryobacterales bacterium]